MKESKALACWIYSIVKSNWTYAWFSQLDLKGKNSYIIGVKKATEQLIFTGCYFCKIKLKTMTKDVNSRFFCWNIKPTKIRYQYLMLHKKFDYFLSKFKVQIKVRWSHYIYFNDQTFSLQKRSFSYITFCKKHC